MRMLVMLLALLLIVGCTVSDSSKTSKDAPYKITRRETSSYVPPPKPVWEIGHFVDDFGDRTGETYMKPPETVRGTFSNTATTNSCLDVQFLVKKSAMDIRLFEYCGNHPVKNYYDNGMLYTIAFKTDSGERQKINARNYSIGIAITDMDFDILHKTFLKSHSIQFYIYETGTPSTEYHFTVNADGYTVAYSKL